MCWQIMISTTFTFQSTHPTRECDRTVNLWSAELIMSFQSTHPTRECDFHAWRANAELQNFNPRTLQESATLHVGISLDRSVFQSTHPTRECDLVDASKSVRNLTTISIHAPYKRVRRILARSLTRLSKFQSTHPTRECDHSFVAV